MRLSRLLPVIAAATIAAVVLAGVRSVPDGRQGVVERGGALRPVGPGLHWVAPGARLAHYPSGPVAVAFPSTADTAEGYRVFSAEGAGLDLALTVRFEISPESLATFHAAAHGGDQEAVNALLRPAVREAFATLPSTTADRSLVTSRLEAALAPALGRAGVRLLEVRVDRLELASGGENAVHVAHARSRGRRVLVLGIDAADWTIVDRLRAEGRLPALDRMIGGGASGPLRSIEPLLSPLIWTTIATGVGPERHGILDFLIRDPGSGAMVPATSRLRRAPAIWNIAPAYGRKTGVVGWLATWPAEPIDGFVVSDRFGFLAYAGGVEGAPATDVTHPPGLLDGRAGRITSSASVDDDVVRRYVKSSTDEIAAARRPGFEKGNLVNNFIHTLATAESYAAVGLDLLETERPDLMLVYFEFLDAVCHLFMPFAPPRQPDIPAADYARYSSAVDESYVRQDEILATFLAAADDSTVVMVVSDHGFRSGGARLRGAAGMDDADAARWHLPDGVLVIHGPGVRAGSRLNGARVFDVAPTVLALLGCPAGSDMRGRVLAEAFEAGFFSAADSIRLPSPATLGFAPPEIGPAASNPGGGDAPATGPAPGLVTEHVNLGIVHARDGRPTEAEAEFRKALAIEPGNQSAVNNLASVLMGQEKYAEAEELLRSTVAKDPAYAMGWSNLAVIAQKLGRNREALESYGRALEIQPNDQRSLANRGFLHLDLANPAAAEADFRKALGIAERSAQARFGLGMALLEQGRTAEGTRELEAVLALDPNHARAREVLGRLRP
jgi:predicted AlkP superfamily phosphohydrolase/phosphomutase/Tfp pilus assembly protein PilF